MAAAEPGGAGGRGRRVLQLLLVGLAALVCGLAAGSVAERIWLGERVLPHVVLWGVDYGGQTPQQLRTALQSRREQLRRRVCQLQLRGHSFHITSAEVGFDFDATGLAEQVLKQGREGSWLTQWGWRLARLGSPSEVKPKIQLGDARLQAQLDDWQDEAIEDPPLEATLVYEAGKPVVRDPRAGSVIDRDAVVEHWLNLLLSERPARPLHFELPVVRQQPKLSESAKQAALQRASVWVQGPITLTHPEGELRLGAAQLGAALRSHIDSADAMRVELDAAALDELLRPVRSELEREAQDARYLIDARDTITIEPSVSSRQIDSGDVAAALWQAARTPQRAGTLPVQEHDDARLTTEKATSLGITQKVSSFATHHACCQPRVKNIHRMADLLDGTVLFPGETLSVNERVGPRTQANGFVAGPTIVEGEIEDTFGGGVSQFATTLFNAAFDGGYQIIERQAHSYYFSRYPMAHEATLSFPKPDLIFKNDTAYGLLIRATYTGTTIRIALYGNNEGRKVKRKVSSAFDFVDPSIDYVPDEELKPDEEKVVERGSRGFSVMATRVLTLADGTRQEETRKVVYKPRERVLEVHPCMIPEEDEDHTGDECPEPEEEEQGEAGEGDAVDDAVANAHDKPETAPRRAGDRHGRHGH